MGGATGGNLNHDRLAAGDQRLEEHPPHVCGAGGGGRGRMAEVRRSKRIEKGSRVNGIGGSRGGL